ncbi:MAG: acyl-CoA dehydrogenase, partial [Halieaceae bacterium]|nr:acyl-CoA dehydrogenase [Halieaceae bacterium]
MPEYKAPLRDISFVTNEVLEAEQLFQTLPGYEEATTDLMNAIAEEGAKFAEGVLAPLYQSGDQEGCKWSEEGVATPTGFKEAYQQYIDNGWPSLSADVEAGGQGMPNLLGIINTEMVGTANWAWGMYPGLSHGAIKTIEEHGS